MTTRSLDGKPISGNDILSASISDDGALIVFSSDAYNVKDLVTGALPPGLLGFGVWVQAVDFSAVLVL